jgi:hypothetical protein
MSHEKQDVQTVKKDAVGAMTTENTPLGQPKQAEPHDPNPPKGQPGTTEKPKTVEEPSQHPPKK